MGRPRKPKPEPEIEALQAEAAKPKSADTAIAVISAGKLKKLLAAHRAAKRDSAQIAQALGAEIKEAVSNNHLHGGAFKLVAKLDKMEPEELSLFMDHFEHYYVSAGLEKRANSVMRMDLPEGDEAEGEEETNAVQFPTTAGSA